MDDFYWYQYSHIYMVKNYKYGSFIINFAQIKIFC